MPTSNNVDYDSPGFNFRSLMQYNLNNSTMLLKFLPETMYETLERLEPGFATSNNLASLVECICDPNDILSNQETRGTVIRLLPPSKATELCAKIGIDTHGNPVQSILEVVDEPATVLLIKQFFGVSEEEFASGVHQPPQTSVAAGYGLFEHQRRIAVRTNDVLAQHPRRCVLHMPTGSGKTRTAMHIIAAHMNSKDHAVVVWLSQSVELLDQAADEFEYAWSYLGNRKTDIVRYWGNSKVELSSIHDGFIVAGFSKLVNWDRRSPNQFLLLADNTSLVVVDEAHQAIASTYRTLIETLSTKRAATQLLGLTATPGRTWSDVEADQELARFFAQRKLVLDVDGYSSPVGYLVDSGYLAKPNFRRLPFEFSEAATSKNDNVDRARDVDVSERELNELGVNASRNAMIIEECENLVTRHNRVLVFCPSVSSAKMLTAILKLRGHECEFITADTPPNIRAQKISRYKGNASTPMILLNFGVLSTGFDAPKTSALVVARPTMSLVLYSQMIGRAIRGVKAGGNAEAEIVTIVDTALPGFGSITDAFFNWEDVWRV